MIQFFIRPKEISFNNWDYWVLYFISEKIINFYVIIDKYLLIKIKNEIIILIFKFKKIIGNKNENIQSIKTNFSD